MVEGPNHGTGSGAENPSERQVVDRLRLALRDHAAGVEPAPNSYLTLAARVDDSSPQPPGRMHGVLLAAAALVVLAGVGGVFLGRDRSGDVSAVGGTGSTLSTTIAPARTTTLVPSSTVTAEPPPQTSTPEPAGPSVVAIPVAEVPRARSVDEAVGSFLHLLGLPGEAELSTVDGTATLSSPYDEKVTLAEIFTSSSANGVAVASATSATVTIDRIQLDGGELLVGGSAVAFESVIEVSVISTDGARLASTTTTAGCCEDPAPYEARLRLAGTGEAFVVVSGDNAGSGVLAPFAAQAIRFEVSEDPATYTVFRIHPENDADRGLNVRDLPGTDEGQVLATLPPGTTGIRRLPRMPALVGDSFWWEIEAPDGTVGWVHSSFLTPRVAELSDGELEQLARSTIGLVARAEDFGLDRLGLSRRVPVALGWIGSPRYVTGPTLTDVPYWTEARPWPVPEATYGESEKLVSLRSLLNPPSVEDPEIIPGAALRYGFEQEMADQYFAGTQAVTVIGPADEDEPDRSMVLFYEVGPTGPQLVGAVASIFVP